jgi:hypothetical protein
MKRRENEGLDFVIDKLTNSIDIESLGATHFGGRLMIIDTNAALKLINRYFKNE